MHALLCGLLGWLFAEASFAGINAFTSVGAHGGAVRKVIHHPTNSSVVYAVATSGFYRSTDGGVSWQVVNDRILGDAREIAVHASRPERVYVVSSTGVLSSDDAGATLSRLSTYPDISGFSTDIEVSADGSMIYVSTGPRVYRSADAGNSWLQGGVVPVSGGSLNSLVVDPTNANALYVGSSNGEAFQSADAGVTWQPWQAPGAGINQLAIADVQPLRIWAATWNGTWFTDDRGNSWTNSLPSPATMVTIDPLDPDVVYSGTTNGLRRTIDGGAQWSSIQGAAATGLIYSIAIDRANSNRLLLSGIAGIAGSNDGGASWTSRNAGIDAISSYELVSSPAADRIYLNTLYDGVFAISAADRRVVTLNHDQLRQFGGELTLYGRGLFVHPNTPDRLLMSVLNGIARSTDGGASWSLLSDPAFSNGAVQGIVAASADAQRLAATGSHVYYTANGGNNWQVLNSINATDLGRIVSAPSNPQVVYLVGSAPGSSDAILRSQDGGNSWTTHAFPDADVISIVVDPRTEQTIYAGSGQAVFKSTNGGATWTELAVFGAAEHPFYALAIDPQNPDVVYAGGGSRIARSVDAGATWQELTRNVEPYWDTRALVVDAQRPHSLYAGISGRGVQEFSIQPDLALSGTVPATPIGYGTVATYSYRMRNIGPYDATNARTTVQLPLDATNITANSPGAACTVTGALAACTVPILRVTSGADITISATHPSSGSFAVVAQVQGDQPDAAAANNSVASAIQVAEVTDLAAALAGPAQVTRGDAINYSIAVANAGPNDATAVAISFQLAAGLGVGTVTPSAGSCTTTGNNITCQIPFLARNASATVAIASAATTVAGSFSSVATVDASGSDPEAGNDAFTRVTVVGNPASPSNGGGGGGSSSLWMLAALLLLSRVRTVSRRLRIGR